MSNNKKIISILATNFAGNKGAAAMLKSLIVNLSLDFSGTLEYNLLSVYPKEDEDQNPYSNLKVVSCKPEQIIFVAFPLAIIFYLVQWIKPLRLLLLKNKILKALYESDLVVDEAGISFVDSRGFVMNTYNFICVATPLLLGKRVVKFSQAMGPFSGWNKLLAKIVLPRIKTICARGKGTYEHLNSLGLQNVALCADGAFVMHDSEESRANINNIIAGDVFYEKQIISVSVSSVVEKYCDKTGIDYIGIMTNFIDHLISNRNYGVIIIANAARKKSTARKNNDLIVGQKIYNKLVYKQGARFYNEEFTPEEIREFIGLSKLMVGSRFHAMIGALYKGVPVLLVGWSHKYKEVLDMFVLGQHSTDYKKLNLQDLIEKFGILEKHAVEIRGNISIYLPDVQKSAYNNISIIISELNA